MDNRERLARALAEKGFVLRPPEATDPFAPMQLGLGGAPQPMAPPPAPTQPRTDWTPLDAFTPEGLGVVGNALAEDVFAPIGQGVLDLGRSAIDGVKQFGANLEQRAGAEQAIRDEYWPQIEAANANTSAAIDQMADLDRLEIANVDRADSQLDGLYDRMEALGGPSRGVITEPESLPDPAGMQDDELMAALAEGDEAGFRAWYAQRAEATGLSPDPDDPRHQYDYRAAYRAGAEPELAADGSYHWPSQFKREDHPNRFVVVDGVLTDTMTGAPVAGQGAMR